MKDKAELAGKRDRREGDEMLVDEDGSGGKKGREVDIFFFHVIFFEVGFNEGVYRVL